MPFDESLIDKPKTVQDEAIEAEKQRQIKEYQRPFIEAALQRLREQGVKV